MWGRKQAKIIELNERLTDAQARTDDAENTAEKAEAKSAEVSKEIL